MPAQITVPATLSINYLKLIGDIHNALFSYGRFSITKNLYATPYLHTTYWGKFPYTDERGNKLGTFSAYDFSPGSSFTWNSGKIYAGISAKIPLLIYFSEIGIASSFNIGAAFIDTTKKFLVGLLVKNITIYFKKFLTSSYTKLTPSINIGVAHQIGEEPFWIFASLYNLQKWQYPDSSSSKIISLKNFARHFLLGINYNLEKIGILASFDIGERMDKNVFGTNFLLTGFAIGIKYHTPNFSIIFAMKPIFKDFITFSITFEKNLSKNL